MFGLSNSIDFDEDSTDPYLEAFEDLLDATTPNYDDTTFGGEEEPDPWADIGRADDQRDTSTGQITGIFTSSSSGCVKHDAVTHGVGVDRSYIPLRAQDNSHMETEVLGGIVTVILSPSNINGDEAIPEIGESCSQQDKPGEVLRQIIRCKANIGRLTPYYPIEQDSDNFDIATNTDKRVQHYTDQGWQARQNRCALGVDRANSVVHRQIPMVR